MQYTIETTTGLERKIKVTIPADKIEKEIEERLKNIAKKAKIDGFRPGKAPLQVIRKQYGEGVRLEALEKLMRTTFDEAIKEAKLRVAGILQFSPLPASSDGSFEYETLFELYPDINFVGLENIKIEKIDAEIEEKDLDAVFDKMRKQHTQWEAVNRPAKNDDRITMDFEGTIDDKPFSGNKAKGFQLVLGSHQMIPGFEDALLGAKANSEITINIKFPDNYHHAEVAGKPAKFAVKVHEVSEGKLPPLDDSFAQVLGIKEGGLETLREEVTKTLKKGLTDRIEEKTKTRVLDKILELNPIEVPKVLIQNEAEHLRDNAYQQFQKETGSKQKMNLPLELFNEQAKRRVALALLLSAAVRKYEIQPDTHRMKAKIQSIASMYQDPRSVITWYSNNKQAFEEIQAAVLEEQMVEKLLEAANVVAQKQSYNEVMDIKNPQ